MSDLLPLKLMDLYCPQCGHEPDPKKTPVSPDYVLNDERNHVSSATWTCMLGHKNVTKCSVSLGYLTTSGVERLGVS